MEATNPWRDAVIAALKERNRYFERDDRSPAELLEDLLREVGGIASSNANRQLGALAGLADQLVQAGLAIRSAQQPEERNDVALTYQQSESDQEPRISEDTIPAIDGWKIGCMVQSRYRGVDHVENEWRDVGLPGRPCTPNFMHPMMEYRVKPGDLVVFDDGKVFEYQPHPPLDWSDAP